MRKNSFSLESPKFVQSAEVEHIREAPVIQTLVRPQYMSPATIKAKSTTNPRSGFVVKSSPNSNLSGVWDDVERAGNVAVDDRVRQVTVFIAVVSCHFDDHCRPLSVLRHTGGVDPLGKVRCIVICISNSYLYFRFACVDKSNVELCSRVAQTCARPVFVAVTLTLDLWPWNWTVT